MSNLVKKALSDLDKELITYLDIDNPKSFFLFAGAGSGKTRSLVTVLEELKANFKKRLALKGQRIAVITYTNAASDEINARLEHDNLFFASTIHRFAWKLIQPYQSDIKKWVAEDTKKRISEYKDLNEGSNPNTKTYKDRERKIESKTKRLQNLSNIKKFSYNPNGDNFSRDSVNHSEVLEMCSYFLVHNDTMQEILVQKFPILLIDESQDTNKHLMEAFFQVQSNKKEKFALGLFGDMMQRIYFDGKINLGQNLPDDWETPSKTINYRCPKRVIELINKIRSYDDKQVQEPNEGQVEGIVRLFIVSGEVNKQEIEEKVSEKMMEVTQDELWSNEKSEVKALILEHHMAASRMGFLDFFAPLYGADRLKTGILDGSLSDINFFTKLILPLIEAHRDNDEFGISRIVTRNSLLFESDFLKEKPNQLEILNEANEKTDSLIQLWDNDNDPTLIQIIENVISTGLFLIPEVLKQAFEWSESEEEIDANAEDFKTVFAYKEAIVAPFSQVEKYYSYISNEAKFGTHQGVKGLEFPRVIVIMDDEESKGNWFSYEKLFKAKALTKTDLNNEAQGKETSIERTRRLFYVTCSRAEKSLAVVAYTQNPESLKKHVLQEEWFSEDEIIEFS